MNYAIKTTDQIFLRPGAASALQAPAYVLRITVLPVQNQVECTEGSYVTNQRRYLAS